MRQKQPNNEPSQEQMFFEAQRKLADADITFLDLVRTGLTRPMLQRCIDHRPSLWKRYECWLEKLPEQSA